MKQPKNLYKAIIIKFAFKTRELLVNDFEVFNINLLLIRKIVISEWNCVFSIKKEHDLFE